MYTGRICGGAAKTGFLAGYIALNLQLYVDKYPNHQQSYRLSKLAIVTMLFSTKTNLRFGQKIESSRFSHHFVHFFFLADASTPWSIEI